MIGNMVTSLRIRTVQVLAVVLLALVAGQVGASTPNEFIVQASNYDKLYQHSYNCTFAVEADFAFAYCDDGYIAIDETRSLLNPSTAFKVEAKWSQILPKAQGPKDVRLDTYLSIVDVQGQRLSVIKKSNLDTLHIQLSQVDAPSGEILGGFFSPDFVVFQIKNQGSTFLQVHTSKQSLGAVAAIESDVLNYEVLDLANKKDLFYVFAAREVSNDVVWLEMIQIFYDVKKKKWQQPAQVTYELDPEQCASRLKVNEGLVILACEATNTITIKRRQGMNTIFQKTFTERRNYFEQMQVISHKDGLQNYIFYSMSQNSIYRIGMIEVLLDEEKSDQDQLVIDYGELAVPSNKGSSASNDGPIKLGGGEQYLLTTFEQFSYIKGYTLCAFDQVLQSQGSTQCTALDKANKFLLNPFEMTVTECGQTVLSETGQQKLAFLCTQEASSALDLFTIVVLATLGLGLICCCSSFCLFCKYRAKSNNAIDDMNQMDERRHDPLMAQRIQEQQKKQKLTLLGKVLSRKKFSQTQHKENQESCAICVEDFESATMIRETPCKHIFHDHCLMKWVETKLQQPDCPFCRAEININNPANATQNRR